MNQPIPNQISKQTFRTPTLQRVQSRAGRLYRLPNGDYAPGVTTALSVMNKPALVDWSARLERQYCLDTAAQTFAEVIGSEFVLNAEGIAEHALAPKFRETMEARLSKARAHQKKLKSAGDIGTELHAAIERWIKERLGQSVGPMPQLSEPALLAFMAFDEWQKSVNFTPLATEVMVYDPYLGYAGTLDWIALVNGTLTLGDNKTGKAIYAEAVLQNAAYLAAVRKQCRLGDVPIQGCIVLFPKELADVKEKPFDVRIIPAEEHKTNFYAFLKALDLWRWINNFNPSKTPRQPATAATPIPTKPAPAAMKWSKPAPGRTAAPQPSPAAPGRLNSRPVISSRPAPVAGVAAR